MAKKISALDPAGALTGVELIPIVQDGVTKRTTVSAFVTGIGALPTSWDHIAEGGPPTDLTKIYYSTDETESVFPYGTLFWTNGSGGWFTK